MQSGNAPLIATDGMQVDPAKAPTRANQNELLSAGISTDPAFAYAVQQNIGLFPPGWEGDNATLDAIWTIAKAYKTPPTAPTLSGLSPNTAVNNAPAFLMTLTGTNFAAGLTVIFGTVTETRVTVISPTSATVTIYPSYIPSAGTIQVSVQNGGGAAASANVAFTVT